MELRELLTGFREGIKTKMEIKRFSAESFASILGVDVERLRKWEKGTMPISEEDRNQIKFYFNIDGLENIPNIKLEEALIRFSESELSIKEGKAKEVIPLGKHIPLRLTPEQFGEAYGDWPGLPMFNVPVTASFIETYRDLKVMQPQYYLHDPRFRDCDFGAIITGDSMHGEIRHGDFIACQEVKDKRFIVFGDIYYVIATNNLETCKYVHPDPANAESLLLVPHNKSIPPSPIPKDMVARMYKVRGIIRGY